MPPVPELTIEQNGELMKESYLLVATDGSIRRVDSEGPIREADIRNQVGGDFETWVWRSEFTCCSYKGAVQSDWVANLKFKNKYRNVLLGIHERGVLRGLKEAEYSILESQIEAL